MPAAAGDIGKTAGFVEISVGVAASTTITKGEVVAFDAGGDCITATSAINVAITGRGVALETVDNSAGADGDLKVRICIAGQVYVVAGATIESNEGLQVDATAGRVGPATIGATVEWNKHLAAFYVGKAATETDTAAAADNDIILVRLL